MYSFPYKAYDIQIQLMDSLYEVLQHKKIAILESPTGTGKSLSIICATIKWLQDLKDKRFNELRLQLTQFEDQIKAIDIETQVSQNWIELQNKKSLISEQRNAVIKELDRIEVFRKRNDSLISRKSNAFVRKKFTLSNESHQSVHKKQRTQTLETDFTPNDLQLDEDLVNYCSDEEVVDDTEETAEDDKYVIPKIYYCSRTHSQLSQFISEIKKTSFASQKTPLRTVPLGSRNNSCVNQNVIQLNNINLINEKCIELQNSSNSKNKCQMHKQVLINELRDEILTDVQDIEEISKLGKHVKACPYYSARLAIPEAEIVVLPYNILLHSGTRQSFGIRLKDSVVIIDEAHNLLETINNIHSIELKGSHIIDAQTQLNQYLTKYYSRLSPKNIMHIKQIIFILNEFIRHLRSSSNSADHNVYEGVNFLIKLGIENLNLLKIVDYCDKSRIARKLHGFTGKQRLYEVESNSQNTNKKVMTGTSAFLARMKGKTIEIESNPINLNNNEEDIQSYGSPLYLIKEFLKTLINMNSNGRIITYNDKTSIRKSSIKYILLNPGSHFKEIVSECRSVVLCGGTMQPFSEYIDHLFKPLGVANERLHTFSCGHVIPDSNLLTVALGVGPNQIALNYTFQNRNNKSLIEETGKTVANLCNVIPGGIVCFLPSYDYEELLYSHWNKSGILKSIESKGKRVFREPKKANLVQSTLAEYSRSIGSVNHKKGALLMCVVGGKMSEGINFSDDLGRGVIVVGLPYANKNSIELQEKLKYLNSFKTDSGNNLCMKAVNQSIGRAIRHQNDYAVIILLDNRYTNRLNIKESLPKWIRSRLMCFDRFPQAFNSIRQFFSNK